MYNATASSLPDEAATAVAPLPGIGDDTLAGLSPETVKLSQLVHHREAVAASTMLGDVQKQLQDSPYNFLAITDAGRVCGLCSRATIGFMLGSRYGFALYGQRPAMTVRAPRPVIVTADTPLRTVLDQALSRAGSEFFEDVVVVDDAGGLVGLVPVPSLARLQLRLFGEQLQRVNKQDDELRRQNLELFQINHQLRQSQGKYKALFENNALGVALLDAEGRILAYNPRFEGLLRLPPGSSCVGRALAEWVGAADQAALRDLLGSLESEIQRPSARLLDLHFELPGGPRVFEIHSSWVVETGQICVFCEDVTEDRMLQRRLAQQEKQNLVDTLVAGVAHELNNKLTPVLGFAELLDGLAPESLRAHTRSIRTSAHEAAEIIRQLLNLSKPNPGPPCLVDLRAVAAEAAEMLRFQLREARCELKLVTGSAAAHVRANPAELKQVIINLVLNALHALEGRASPVVDLVLAADGRRARVTVRDNGIGIPTENLSRIFDPFFTTKGPRGTGLGLSISSRIVRQYGGQLTAESTVGAGSRFTIELPQATATDTPEIAAAPAGRPGPVLAARGRALVVDDEEFVRQFLQEALRVCGGFLVDSARDGLEAVQMLGESSYELVVTDIRMPRMDGLELHRWIKQHRPALAERVVFVTGHAGQLETGDGLAQLPSPLLRKPFTIEALVEVCGRGAGEKTWTPPRADHECAR